MNVHSRSGTYDMNSVVPLAPKSTVPDGTDQLDKAGQTIQRLLHKAAGIVEENSRHAREMAQKLSHQLQAAENRIAELETEIGAYQETG
jgi:hypothetical protein